MSQNSLSNLICFKETIRFEKGSCFIYKVLCNNCSGTTYLKRERLIKMRSGNQLDIFSITKKKHQNKLFSVTELQHLQDYQKTT